MTFEELLTEDARLRDLIERAQKAKEDLYATYLKIAEKIKNYTEQRTNLWDSFQDNIHYPLPEKKKYEN